MPPFTLLTMPATGADLPKEDKSGPQKGHIISSIANHSHDYAMLLHKHP